MKIAICLFLICASAYAYAAIPDANEITDAQDRAGRIVSDFYAETLPDRIKFLYLKKSIDNKFKEVAHRASAGLSKVLDTQKMYKEQIENYPQDDWQIRFEQTGLWNKIQSDIANTILFKARINCYFAQAEQIIIAIDSEPLLASSSQGDLIKAKAYALNGKKEKSLELLNTIKGSDETYFAVTILKLELADANRMDIEIIYDQLIDSDCKKKFELNTQLAFLYLQTGSAKILTSVFEDFPQSRFLLADCIAEKITIAPQSILPAEVELVAKSIMFDSSLRYKDFFIEAINHPHLYSDELFFYAIRFVRYDYKRGVVSCGKVLDAFDKYMKFTQAPDANLYYDYSMILKDCGQIERAIDVLKKIAADTEKHFSCQAQYDLFVEQVSNCSDENTLTAVLALIQSCPGKAEAVSGSAKKILSDLLSQLDQQSSNQNLIKICTELAGVYYGEDSLSAIEFASVIADANFADLIGSLKTIAPNDPDFLRCKGRVLIAIGDFDQAYQVWEKLISILPADPKINQWCCAKYYQLLCLSKSSFENTSQAPHAAEVLLNSYDEIMPFWRKKLISLAENQH